MASDRPAETDRRRAPDGGAPRRPLHRVVGLLGFAVGVGAMGAFVVWQALLVRRESPTSLRPGGVAVAIDLALVGSFGLIHSLLARESMRRRLFARLDPALERSVYTWIAALQIVALIVFWRPLSGIVWDVDSPTGRALLWSAHALGWLVAVAGFHAAGATHLFGLAQARASAAGRPYVEPPLVTTGLYAWIRHPLYAGTLAALWSLPTMTDGRLLLAATLTAYVAIGARLEERDLARRHGEVYRSYRAGVPAYVPTGTRGGSSPTGPDG
jgi:protein-S-isoprenylcysteine O-methyltransferase Ste14